MTVLPSSMMGFIDSRLRGNDDSQGFIRYFYDYVFYDFVRPHQNI